MVETIVWSWWQDVGFIFFVCHGVNKNKTKENPDKASVSRSNDTENYLPCWEGWFVEAGKAVETAFDITAGSEDDASVKVHDKNTLTQYRFQLFKYYISFFFIVLIFLCSICRWLCQNCYRWLGGDYALMVKCEVISHDGGILEKLFFSLRVYEQRRSPGEKKKNKQTNKQEKQEKEKGNFPATILTSCLVYRRFTIYGLNDENLCLLNQRWKFRGAVSCSFR